MNRLVINKYSIEKMLPFYCGCVVYKTIHHYFSYLVPSLASVFTLMYNLVTLLLLVSYVPLAMYVFSKWNRFKLLRPALIIPLFVVINIVFAIFQTGDLSIVSRGHFMPLAAGTIDATGYYFSQINTWFGNMAVILTLSVFATEKETIKKCVLYSAFMLFLPAFLVVITHPEQLGIRQAAIEGTDILFAGGLWNIGVMGFGSIAWLGLALAKDMTKMQKRFIVTAVVLFAFLGVAGLSRTLIMMLALSACTYFLVAKKDTKLFTKVVLVLIAVLVFVLAEKDVVGTLIGRMSDSTSGTNNVRVSLWKAYMSHYKETWLVGAPYGNIYNYYYDVEAWGLYYMPHSAPINFFVRFGVFAALAYLALIKNAFLSYRISEVLSRNQYACVLAGFVSYFSLAIINQTGYAEPIFYIMFGLFLAYSQILKKEESEIQYENRDRNEDR